jgi:hypothetical protein
LKIFSKKIDKAKPGTVSRKHCSNKNGAVLSYFWITPFPQESLRILRLCVRKMLRFLRLGERQFSGRKGRKNKIINVPSDDYFQTYPVGHEKALELR